MKMTPQTIIASAASHLTYLSGCIYGNLTLGDKSSAVQYAALAAGLSAVLEVYVEAGGTPETEAVLLAVTQQVDDSLDAIDENAAYHYSSCEVILSAE